MTAATLHTKICAHILSYELHGPKAVVRNRFVLRTSVIKMAGDNVRQTIRNLELAFEAGREHNKRKAVLQFWEHEEVHR